MPSKASPRSARTPPNSASGRARWPDIGAYTRAVQNSRTSFEIPALRSATATPGTLGLPRRWSGNFAIVYQLQQPSGAKSAVRCFLRPLGDAQERYRAISQHLRGAASRLPWFTRFEFHPAGVRIDGATYPVLEMDWVEGRTLDEYVRTTNAATLAKLAADWITLQSDLERVGTAHGDLQHANVLVEPNGRLRLVDYDGMFVPALAGKKPSEFGLADYQHPRRTPDQFDEKLDRFSALVIHTSLLACAEQPQRRAACVDGLLFHKADFEVPARSQLFRELSGAGTWLGYWADALRGACAADPRSVPSLADLSAHAPAAHAQRVTPLHGGWWTSRTPDSAGPTVAAGTTQAARTGPASTTSGSMPSGSTAGAPTSRGPNWITPDRATEVQRQWTTPSQPSQTHKGQSTPTHNSAGVSPSRVPTAVVVLLISVLIALIVAVLYLIGELR